MVETFAENCSHTLTQVRKGKEPILWIRERKLDVKNIVDKEIKGQFETNYPTEQQIRKYKRHGSEFIESIKIIYAHECIIIPMIIHCRVSTQKKIKLRSKLGFINMI